MGSNPVTPTKKVDYLRVIFFFYCNNWFPWSLVCPEPIVRDQALSTTAAGGRKREIRGPRKASDFRGEETQRNDEFFPQGKTISVVRDDERSGQNRQRSDERQPILGTASGSHGFESRYSDQKSRLPSGNLLFLLQ